MEPDETPEVRHGGASLRLLFHYDDPDGDLRAISEELTLTMYAAGLKFLAERALPVCEECHQTVESLADEMRQYRMEKHAREAAREAYEKALAGGDVELTQDDIDRLLGE